MIYSVDLRTVGLVVGVALVVAHVFALIQSKTLPSLMKGFPRSRVAGTILIAIAAVWSFLLLQSMDLGEFARLRGMLLGGTVVGAVLAWMYMEEFLAVRALGMIALLAAEPILSAAFLRPETSKLLVVILAYAWIVLGLFWVGMPWLLRDQITWLTARAQRFQAAAWAGAIYGAVIIACAVLLWKPVVS